MKQLHFSHVLTDLSKTGTDYYANDMEICGIVLTSSMYHYAGDAQKGIAPYRWTGTSWMYEMIDAYEKIHPNLIVHDPRYPDANALRSLIHIGNISCAGEMEEETDGAKFLADLFIEPSDQTLMYRHGVVPIRPQLL